MGILGDIAGFFGDEILGESPSTDTQTLDVLTEQQQNILRKLLKQIFQGLSGVGAEVPGVTPLQQQSLAGLEAAAGGVAGASQQAQSELDPISAFIQQLVSGQSPFLSTTDDEAFFKTNVEQPLLETFNEQVIPGIQSSFAPQIFGGETGRAVEIATGELAESLAGARTGLARSREQLNIQKLGAQLGAGQLGLGVAGARTDAAGAPIDAFLKTLTGGEVERQAGLDVLDERSRRIQEIFRLLGIPVFENVVTAQPGTSGLLSDFLTGLN